MPLKRNIFQRLFGICATRLPNNDDCWTYADGKITIDLARAPELEKPGSGLRIEGDNLPDRYLIVYGDDDKFHAFRNHCEHAGRRLDPVPGDEVVQCCSMGKSTYDYQGKIISGSAKDAVKTYPVEVQEGRLIISVG